jgi:hypothetical protein
MPRKAIRRLQLNGSTQHHLFYFRNSRACVDWLNLPRLWFPCSDNTHSVPRVYSNIIALIIHVDQMMSVGN